jgi:hypothetical protein
VRRRATGRAAMRAAAAVAAVAATIAAATGCARWAREPRFGPLRADARAERFVVDVRVRTLGNGAQVALATIPGAADVTIDVRYRVGAGDDPPDRRGLAHLAEHATFLLDGDAGHPGLGDALATLAIDRGARTTADRTHFVARVAPTALAAALALEARRMAGCDALPLAGFERERAVVLAEHAQRQTPLTAALTDALIAIYGADHRYAQPLDGPELARASAAEACRFVRERYVPGAATVVVTGALPADAAALLARTIGAVPARPVIAAPPSAPPRRHGAVVERAAPVASPTVLVALPLPARGGPLTRGLDALRERLPDALATATQALPWALGTTVVELGGPQAPALVAAVEVTAPSHVADAPRRRWPPRRPPPSHRSAPTSRPGARPARWRRWWRGTTTPGAARGSPTRSTTAGRRGWRAAICWPTTAPAGRRSSTRWTSSRPSTRPS